MIIYCGIDSKPELFSFLLSFYVSTIVPRKRLNYLEESSEPMNNSLTESRIVELRRQQQREKFARQLEEARNQRNNVDSGRYSPLSPYDRSLQFGSDELVSEKDNSYPDLMPELQQMDQSKDDNQNGGRKTDLLLNALAAISSSKSAAIYPSSYLPDEDSEKITIPV
jgi:hypothetical protein